MAWSTGVKQFWYLARDGQCFIYTVHKADNEVIWLRQNEIDTASECVDAGRLYLELLVTVHGSLIEYLTALITSYGPPKKSGMYSAAM